MKVTCEIDGGYCDDSRPHTVFVAIDYDTGWTQEDRQIWRDRKMKPHTIHYRAQNEERESRMMINLTKIPIKPSHAKFIALQFM